MQTPPAPSRPQPRPRSHFRAFVPATTRWHDNDVYGHVNNVVYYAFFDTAVNQLLVEACVLDPATSTMVGLVVETRCTYFASIAFPDAIEIGVRVAHLGRSSVRYDLGVFRRGEENTCALGEFTHVYVDRTTQKPISIPDNVRAVLATLSGAP
jgi:acyl-CoA thioester hydrolase